MAEFDWNVIIATTVNRTLLMPSQAGSGRDVRIDFAVLGRFGGFCCEWNLVVNQAFPIARKFPYRLRLVLTEAIISSKCTHCFGA